MHVLILLATKWAAKRPLKVLESVNITEALEWVAQRNSIDVRGVSL